MTQTESFKGDFFKSIWEHTLKMVRYSALIGVLYFIVIMTAMFGILTRVLHIDFEKYIALAQKPFENKIELEQFYGQIGNQFIENWALFLVIFLAIILFQAYVYSVLIQTSSDVAQGKEPKILSIFTNTSLASVVHIFLAGICILFIYMALSTIAMILGNIHALLAVAMFLFIILVIIRLFAFLPGIVLAKLGIIDSLRYSLERMTWNRAAKMILISIALGIAFFVILMMINTITIFLGSIGASISMLLNIAIQIFVLAGISSLFTGIHYRYLNDDNQLDSIEE